MATRLVQVNMKARDDSALGGFWAEALGWRVSSEGPGVTNLEPEGFVYPDPVAVCLDLVASPEPKTVKNRAHLDLATTSATHQAALVARLQGLGATPADVGQGDVSWTVMADPEGNEFCVLAPWPGGRDTGPVAAVTVDCADPPIPSVRSHRMRTCSGVRPSRNDPLSNADASSVLPTRRRGRDSRWRRGTGPPAARAPATHAVPAIVSGRLNTAGMPDSGSQTGSQQRQTLSDATRLPAIVVIAVQVTGLFRPPG